ncbi:energy transducer TonB family protein [Acinetobacter sp. ANC 5502]
MNMKILIIVLLACLTRISFADGQLRIVKDTSAYWVVKPNIENAESIVSKYKNHEPVRVVVFVATDDQGRVIKAQVRKSSGIQEFDRSVLDALQKARFSKKIELVQPFNLYF